MTNALDRVEEGAVRVRRAFVGLGSNVEDAPARLERALARLHDAGERIAAVATPVSSPYEDEAGAPVGGARPVLNSVAEVVTERSARALLALLRSIETDAGRDRSDPAVRALDLDLLDAGEIVTEPELVLPHPRALGRAFVLGPWEEMAPGFEVTGTGRTVLEHAADLRARRPDAFRALDRGPGLAWPAHGSETRVLHDAETLAAWRDARSGVGVVPTMGALHDGHESLLRRARAECDHVLATLFVNPLQFGQGEDLDRYPTTFEEDLERFRRSGVDAVYAPSRGDLYPAGFSTYVVPEGPAEGLEGARRADHFRGVATVVHKLWRRTRPDRAYFGRKDAQQVAVVVRMVRDLDLGGVVVPCPTVREADGLALSSRNRYLSAEERAQALGLSRALEALVFEAAEGTTDTKMLKARGLRDLDQAGLDVDYLEIVDAVTMELRSDLVEPALAVAAVRMGRIRLLDNRWLALGRASGAEHGA